MCWVQGIYLDRHRVLNSETDAPCCFQSEIEETKPAGIVAAPVVDTCGIGLTLPVPRTEEPTVLDTSAEGHRVASRSVGIDKTQRAQKHNQYDDAQCLWELDVEGAVIFRTSASFQIDAVRVKARDPNKGSGDDVWSLDLDCQRLYHPEKVAESTVASVATPIGRVRLGAAACVPAPREHVAKISTGVLELRSYASARYGDSFVCGQLPRT